MLTRLAAVTAAAALVCLGLGSPSASAHATGSEAVPTALTDVSTPEVTDSAVRADAVGTTPMTTQSATEALTVAERVTEGAAQVSDPEASEALSSLFVARAALSAPQQRRADRLLARPTDGARDPAGFGYDRPSARTCGPNICVHWVPSGSDKPTSRAWVNRNLSVLETVWRRTLAQGWKAPAPDGRRGGNAKLDVYLKDIGATRNYGYCIQERAISRQPARATAYCVLDNTFSRAKFGQAPLRSLKATAAHEFFHAVQSNMDYLEDPWMKESTATWMEERIFDGVNDNRQYLKYSQLASPTSSLDTVDADGRQYSSWLFWEYLSKRFGPKVVRNVWTRATRPGVYSLLALSREMSARGTTLRQVFSDQIAATRYPATYWPEGGAYRSWLRTTGAFAPYTVNGVATVSPTLDHLSGMAYRARPGDSLSTTTKLRVQVSTNRRRGAAATVLVRRTDGSTTRRTVPVSASGTGSVTVRFGRGTVREVVIGVSNGSSRMNCSAPGAWSCFGTPRDNQRTINVTLTPLG